MSGTPRIALLGLALPGLLSPGTGCSYLFSKPPPKQPLQFEEECSTSRLPVAGDVYWTLEGAAVALVGFGGAAIAARNASDETVPSWNPRPSTRGTVPVLLAVGALGTVAMVATGKSVQYGLKSARDCDAARVELQRARAWSAPPVWYWPPPGQPGAAPPPYGAPPYGAPPYSAPPYSAPSPYGAPPYSAPSPYGAPPYGAPPPPSVPPPSPTPPPPPAK